eukprot:4019678-Prymnesium_polylepis.1
MQLSERSIFIATGFGSLFLSRSRSLRAQGAEGGFERAARALAVLSPPPTAARCKPQTGESPCDGTRAARRRVSPVRILDQFRRAFNSNVVAAEQQRAEQVVRLPAVDLREARKLGACYVVEL